MSTVTRLFVCLFILSTGTLQLHSQVNFSDQAGGFGPFIGLIRSNLKQPQLGGDKTGVLDMYQGWEAGLKSEMYRTQWLRGNILASFVQQGATEYFQTENTVRPVDIDLQEIKLAVNPLLFKVGSDFFHGYLGGGIYGSYIINEKISDPDLVGQYWTSGDELKGGDIGLDLTAGIHIWSFDIEAHAQYGLLDLGARWDGSTVRHQFFGLSLTYLYVNQHVTRKSCRDTRKSNPKSRM
jgi:hypothetical protein